jgi:hypothetical protein
MYFQQKPQQVQAIQFPEECELVFPPTDQELPKQRFVVGPTDWLVFLPNGVRLIVEHKDFVRRYQPLPPQGKEKKPTSRKHAAKTPEHAEVEP